ncbi:MAG: sigma-54 dependent transcriptional regulator [Candidatus Krumholzibacteria bacterium]|nr:sigma-54 dependent transcriptional regulator [Candidatus Krumholzibacteria bacterium]
MTSLNARILIVDDEPMLRRTMSDRMQFWDCTTEEAATGEEALEMLGQKSYDLVLLDLKMPGISGLEVMRAMRERNDLTDVVVLTAHGSVEAAVEAIKAGAADFLLKPADFELVHNTVKRVLASRRLSLAHEALQEQHALDAPFVTGDSPAMKALVESAGRAARSKATILLRGESGSGKGVIAEYVHRESDRRKGPYVYVNCVALSDDLIESTLFGHERGAFTGAVARKAGRFEAANSGTAFLDEIGDISPRLQTKLLHFLETGEFERVGGTRTLSVDCRIVAATNRDLEKAVREGNFREDLLYRLNVIGLEVPPLRDRGEDISLLAEFFLVRFASELKRPQIRIAPETRAVMRAYCWPGNVRQMKNAMERMVVMAPGEVLTPDLLPPEVLRGEDPTAPPVFDSGELLPLREAELAFRKQHYRRALAMSCGNQTKAAELLGIQRSSLNRQMKELGLREDGTGD